MSRGPQVLRVFGKGPNHERLRTTGLNPNYYDMGPPATVFNVKRKYLRKK